MKKYVVGFIAGALFMFSFQVYGGEISLVGKVFQKEVPVELNGERLSVPGGISDGITYLPTRELSEKFGLKVEWENETVILKHMNYDDLVIKDKQKELEKWIENLVKKELEIKEQLKLLQDLGENHESFSFQKARYDGMLEAKSLAENKIIELKSEIQKLQAKLTP